MTNNCNFCKIELSNKSSYNRHLFSDKHKHNIKNPYYTFVDKCQNIPLDIINLIWEITYINDANYKLFDYLEDGYIWKAQDIIFRRKMEPITYNPVPINDINNEENSNVYCSWLMCNKSHLRQIHVCEDPQDYHKRIYFHVYGHFLEVDILDVDYVWSKIKGIKNKASKVMNFGSIKNHPNIEILR